LGHFNDYLTQQQQLNELAKDRGWPEATFWVRTAGTANEFIGEIDYRIWPLSSAWARSSGRTPKRWG
jgi:hypothetical protein